MIVFSQLWCRNEYFTTKNKLIYVVKKVSDIVIVMTPVISLGIAGKTGVQLLTDVNVSVEVIKIWILRVSTCEQ